MRRLLYTVCFCFAFGLLLLNCDAPYQPYSSILGGYIDDKLSGDNYSVSFHGNGYTSVEVAHNHAKKRAKEVCEKKGFKDYQLLSLKKKIASYVIGSDIGCYVKNSKQICEDFGSRVKKPTVTIDFKCSLINL